MHSADPHRLRFFETAVHPCNYLSDRWARTVVADPGHPMDDSLYSELARHGFRRSGAHVYRPVCPDCNACVPVRVDVDAFTPRRAQARVRRRNADVVFRVREAAFAAEHFALYQRYQRARHADSEMADHDESDYRSFLLTGWCRTELVEMHVAGRLMGVAVLDVLEDGLSAVYSFFDPADSARSPGVLAILHAIDTARARGLPWLYLGYWIAECGKMSYKNRYLPQQHLLRGGWTDVPG